MEDLAKRLLTGREITLHYKKYNDGTKEEPNILIYRVSARIITDKYKQKDIAVYLSEEDDESIFDTSEIYRMPVINDLNILIYMLKESKKQCHIRVD